ncbi:DUF6338 family protein [Arthrobacter sp. ZBG10]|uniref:DUF6338 family protein n=1 Tax=Arthrobacter sp. ZBG10 TaxID=1676590 RepID=UPI003FA49564
MTLDGLEAIVTFLLLVAPGAIWELERSKFVPGVKESSLIELARIALVSLLGTGTAVVVTMPLFWWPFYRDAEASKLDPFLSPVSTVPYVAAAVVTSGIACLIVYFVALCKWPTRRSITGIRLWHRYFVTRRPLNAGDPVLIVELMEETIWKGPVTGFDSDPEDSQRWLSLTQPMSRKRRGHLKFERISSSMDSVLLPENQIKSIQVSYPSAKPLSKDRAEEEPDFRSVLGDVRTLAPRISAWSGRRLKR